MTRFARLPATGLSLLLLVATPALAGTDLLQRSLSAAGLEATDLGFGLLPQQEDSLALDIVGQVLAGRRIDHWADSLARALEEHLSLEGLGRELAATAAPLYHPLTSDQNVAPLPRNDTSARVQRRQWSEWLGTLAARRFIDPADCVTLEEDLLSLSGEDDEQAAEDVFTLDQREREARLERDALVARLCREVRQRRLEGMQALLPSLDSLVLALPRLKAAFENAKARSGEIDGTVCYRDEWLLVGGSGPNIYRGELPPIVIDLGGDDLYLSPVAVTHGGVSLCLDLGGNDVYRAAEGPALAVAGLSLLLDLDGDDQYLAGDNSLATGLGGLSILLDHAGNDHYLGGQVGQGAGILGWGILVDSAGRDRYECTLYGQGYGGPAGIGLLLDGTGDDSYEARPAVTDFIRYEDHSLSLSQGFGYGMRPVLCGGLGLLVDGGGQDHYTCDIYGQGAAYWYALGALVDRGGGDTYTSWQYAQGAGIHLAGGVLLDNGGSDCYRSHGVAQGCGHDLGIGWLEDHAGEDYYLSEGLSQGAGSANGAGVLLDHTGNDLYALRIGKNSQGYGNPRRNSGSLGLFADGGGDDHYLGAGAQDSLWRGSLLGFGGDFNLDATPGATSADATPAAEPEAPVLLDQEFDSLDTVQRLHVWAIWSTRVRHRWQAERVIVQRQLRERRDEYLPWLAGQLASSESWERHGIRETLLTFGEDALPFYAAVLDTAGSSSRGLLLWVLSDLPDVGNGDLFRPLLQRIPLDEGGSRGLCLINLALREKEHGGPSCRGILEAGLAEPDPRVRAAAAYALGKLPPEDSSLNSLIATLDDPALHVRQAARLSLLADSTRVPELLEQSLDALDASAESNALLARRLLELLSLKDPDSAMRRIEDATPAPWLEDERRLQRGERSR